MKNKPTPSHKQFLQQLVDCGKQFYERRWMWGTAGNLSVRLKSDPLEIAISPSGVNKGQLAVKDLIRVKDSPHPTLSLKGEGQHPQRRRPSPFREKVAEGRMRVPSAETVIHQAVFRAVPGAGAVFHVHPVFSTLISKLYGHPKEPRALPIEWFEMMKGVGVNEGENAEVMILPNWQDVSLVARDLTYYLKTSPKALPVVLIYNHGLTGWGTTPDQARNHLEIMEYVCEYIYWKRLSENNHKN